MARKPTSRDFELTRLEVFPETLLAAMRRGDTGVIRGIQALGGTSMWQDLNPCVRLLQRLVNARKRGERKVNVKIIEDFLHRSAHFDDFLRDLGEWGLLVREPDDERNEAVYMAGDLWDTLIESLDKREPKIGLRGLGQILGMASFAKHAEKRLRIGLTNYAPIEMIVDYAMKHKRKINKEEVEDIFARYSGSDAERKRHEVIYGDKDRPQSLRLIDKDLKEYLIINSNVIRAHRLNLTRARRLFRKRYQI